MSHPETTVRTFYEAYQKRQRQQADALIAPDFSFTSPYDNAIDRAMYFSRCWPPGDQIQDFTLERIVDAGEHSVFVTYLLLNQSGLSFRNTEYIVVRDGQLLSVDVYFGASYRDGTFVAQPTA